MVASGLQRPRNARRLQGVLEGTLRGQPLFRFRSCDVVRHGVTDGTAVGGNLSVLVSLLGTPWEPSFDDAVVFLEDVGEPLYRLDRMLTHLRSSGRLRNVKALMSGSLRACRPARERARRWRQLLEETAPEGVPVVTGLPFGHGAVNLALPVGAELHVDTRHGCVVWS
jgi:muramoyltetrapeptide carboxypeptidase